MAQINVIHAPVGETLTVYWDNPEREEAGDGLLLIKGAQREAICFEHLYFQSQTSS